MGFGLLAVGIVLGGVSVARATTWGSGAHVQRGSDVDLSRAFGFDFDAVMNTDAGITLTVDSGADWMRMVLDWMSIQPEKPGVPNPNPDDTSYHWDAFDAQVLQATSHGFQIVVLVAGSPSWAANMHQGPVTDTEALAAFAQAVVERYDGDGAGDAPGSPVVRYWEFFNEPDTTDLQSGIYNRAAPFGLIGDQYTSNILMTVYGPVKEASADAQVVIGGIAHDWFLEDGGVFDRNFLDEVLDAGGCAYFDQMNWHSYPYYDWRWAADGGDVVGKATEIRRILAAHDCDKPMMITEIGYYLDDNFERQANYVVKGLVRTTAADVYPVIWYRFRDVPNSDFGLVDPDLNAREGYFALQVLTGQLQGAKFVRIVRSPSSTPSPSGLEVYQFQFGSLRRYVLWTEHTGSVDTFALNATAATMTTRDGLVSRVQDCDDGQCDGRVTITATNQPSFVDVTPPVFIPFVK